MYFNIKKVLIENECRVIIDKKKSLRYILGHYKHHIFSTCFTQSVNKLYWKTFNRDPTIYSSSAYKRADNRGKMSRNFPRTSCKRLKLMLYSEGSWNRRVWKKKKKIYYVIILGNHGRFFFFNNIDPSILWKAKSNI